MGRLMRTGQRIYERSCATCHQVNGQGSGTFPAMAGNPNVTARDPVPVIEQVLHGGGGMPAFETQLSDQEIAAVVTYIRNAWENDAFPVTAEQVSEQH